jgi:hypothetical protein
MSFEGQAIFYSDQNLVAGGDVQHNREGAQENQLARDEAFLKFMHFVLEV